ncbi:putative cell survival pathways protein [Blyttiomyces sp. JEL0837]|nr:putative cell survival pathways protein [Blyttiomyces sp. JEL0837]
MFCISELKKSGSRMSLTKKASMLFGGGSKEKEAEAAHVKANDRAPSEVPVQTTTVTEDDLKWQLSHSSATEGETFYMTLDNGAFTFVQITARFYSPDGTTRSKSYSPAGSALKLSEDRLSVDCDQMSIKFLPESFGFRVKVDCGDEMFYDFEFIPTDALMQVNDGRVPFYEDPAAGFVQASFGPKCKVSGTITIDGKKMSASGHGLFTKAIQNKPQTIGKWNFVNFQSDHDSLMMYEYEMPPNNTTKLDIVSIGALVRNGKNVALTTENRAVHVTRQLDSFSNYEIPTEVLLKWKGKTLDGEDFSCEIPFKATKNMDKIDILSELPWMLRKFIQTFITAPFLYMWYETVTAKVTVGTETFEMTGKLFLEVTFLCTMP